LKRFVPRHVGIAGDDVEDAPEGEFAAIGFGNGREVFWRLHELHAKLTFSSSVSTMTGDAVLIELLLAVVEYRSPRPALRTGESHTRAA
jgi:hypothetical protein